MPNTRQYLSKNLYFQVGAVPGRAGLRRRVRGLDICSNPLDDLHRVQRHGRQPLERHRRGMLDP